MPMYEDWRLRSSMVCQCWKAGRFQKSESYMPLYGGPQRPSPSSMVTRRFSGAIQYAASPLATSGWGLFLKSSHSVVPSESIAPMAGRYRQQPRYVIELFVRICQVSINTGGICDKNDLTRLIGLVVAGIVPPRCALGDDLVFGIHVGNELHRLNSARGVQVTVLLSASTSLPPCDQIISAISLSESLCPRHMP